MSTIALVQWSLQQPAAVLTNANALGTPLAVITKLFLNNKLIPTASVAATKIIVTLTTVVELAKTILELGNLEITLSLHIYIYKTSPKYTIKTYNNTSFAEQHRFMRIA